MKDFYEHIDDYIADRLNEIDRAEMERAIENDEQLRDAVDNHEIAMMILDAGIEAEIRGVIDEELFATGEKSSEGESGSGAQKASRKPTHNRKFLIILVAIILVAAVYFLLNKAESSPKEMRFADIYVAPAWPTDRGSNDEISKAISNYKQGDESSAISELKSMKNAEANYWLSEVFLEKQQGDSVLYYLPDVAINTGELRRDRMLFIEILAVYLQGNKPQVELMINDLPADMDSWYLDRLEGVKD